MAKLLEIWGSIAGVAVALDVPYPTAQSWLRRGVPGKRYVEIIRAAERDGHVVTLEDLIGETSRVRDVA